DAPAVPRLPTRRVRLLAAGRSTARRHDDQGGDAPRARRPDSARGARASRQDGLRDARGPVAAGPARRRGAAPPAVARAAPRVAGPHDARGRARRLLRRPARDRRPGLAMAVARGLAQAIRREPEPHRPAGAGPLSRAAAVHLRRSAHAGLGDRAGSGVALSPARVDLLVLAEVRWGYFRTRKQFLLSRFPERWRVFYAQTPAFGGDDPWEPRQDGSVTYFTVPWPSTGTTSALYNRVVDWGLGCAAVEWWAERYLRR